jgi:hypothetical protein
LFINGVCRGTKSGVSADAMGGSSDPVKIAGENRFPGRISNMHVVKGSTVYTYGTTVGTTYFTPPTTPLTAVAGTQLLLPLTTTPFTDISTNTLTVTNTGTVASIVLSPFTSTDTTGTYPINVVNPTPRISWNSANGGVFRVTTASTNNFMTFGPDFSSSTQAFTVGMAYKWNGATAGRLLNANTGSPDFLMGLWGSGTCRMNIAFAGTFIGSSSDAADTAWHFIWFTCTGTVSATRSKSYIATNTQPTTTYGTGSDNGGFNGLRLFGRFVNSTTSSEEVDADVGFVKVWDGELTLAQIQAQYATYAARFGY